MENAERSGLWVLVVENDPAAQALLTSGLEMDDHEVDVVDSFDNYKRFLEAIPEGNRTPNVLVSDYDLNDGPGKGGDVVRDAVDRDEAGKIGLIAILGFSSHRGVFEELLRKDNPNDKVFAKPSEGMRLIDYISTLPRPSQDSPTN